MEKLNAHKRILLIDDREEHHVSHEPEPRAGDSDRSAALDRLGNYFADGFLTVDEFDERSGKAAVAKTRSELEGLFADLPAQTQAPVPAERAGAEIDTEKELDDVLARNRKVQAADGVIWAAAMILFFLGLFVFNWPFFWVVFPVAGLASWGARGIFQISDEDEELATELEEKEQEERAARLRKAAERRRELGK